MTAIYQSDIARLMGYESVSDVRNEYDYKDFPRELYWRYERLTPALRIGAIMGEVGEAYGSLITLWRRCPDDEWGARVDRFHLVILVAMRDMLETYYPRAKWASEVRGQVERYIQHLSTWTPDRLTLPN